MDQRVSLKPIQSYQSARNWNLPVPTFCKKKKTIFSASKIFFSLNNMKFAIHELQSKVINLILRMFEPKLGGSGLSCPYLMHYVIYETSDNILH